MSDDDESILERIGRMISERFEFLTPVWIVKRPEFLTIIDYRPTFAMLLAGLGFVSMTGALFYLFYKH